MYLDESRVPEAGQADGLLPRQDGEHQRQALVESVHRHQAGQGRFDTALETILRGLRGVF